MEQIVEGIGAAGGIGTALIALAIAGLVGLFNVLGSALKAAREEIGSVISLYFELWKLRIKTRIANARRQHPGFEKFLRQHEHTSTPAKPDNPGSPPAS